ncbi:hypothetical protein A5649_02670 [Mycolicibacter heraklionensis]|uniref:Uncharacterized protein n=1 Tax=Mycolicibacter heraklionensis TaxID=512402 RepID=A0AA91F1B4_9MYCO|nr:hypothetical protein A5649_02670 [Mycolicibacter heraklionensis]
MSLRRHDVDNGEDRRIVAQLPLGGTGGSPGGADQTSRQFKRRYRLLGDSNSGDSISNARAGTIADRDGAVTARWR